ncbi:hypothetical protein ACQ4N7_08440 [Nodosilinea sp. AN01ver1]
MAEVSASGPVAASTHLKFSPLQAKSTSQTKALRQRRPYRDRLALGLLCVPPGLL